MDIPTSTHVSCTSCSTRPSHTTTKRNVLHKYIPCSPQCHYESSKLNSRLVHINHLQGSKGMSHMWYRSLLFASSCKRLAYCARPSPAIDLALAVPRMACKLQWAHEAIGDRWERASLNRHCPSISRVGQIEMK